MPRIALTKEQKVEYKLNDLRKWVFIQMRELGISQEDVGKELGITQQAVSIKLNPKTYKKNKNADPFKSKELLILFDLLDATPEDKVRLLSI